MTSFAVYGNRIYKIHIEDINFILSWWIQYERSQCVKYCFHHSKIKSISSLTHRVISSIYYMAQATSGEIACSNWLRRVTCWSVIFRSGPFRITCFISHFVYEGTTKGNFETPQKFNEFSKLSTKSCMSRTMNNLKECFTVLLLWKQYVTT